VYNQALNAYRQVDRTTTSGRETEARVLTEAAQRLKKCQEHWGSARRETLLDDALRYNQKVWSLFQSELAQDTNPLPKKLRIDILRLAAFIDKRIFEIMAFPSPEKLNIVININQNLAAGLRGSSGPGM